MVSPRGGGKQAAPPPCPPSKHRPRLWRSCACPGDPSPRPVRFPRGLPLAGCLGAAWGLWWAWPAKGRGSHSETPCCPHQGSGWRVWGPRDPGLERGEEPDPAVGLGGPGAWWGGLLWPSAPLSGLVFPQPLQAPGSDPKPLCFRCPAWGGPGLLGRAESHSVACPGPGARGRHPAAARAGDRLQTPCRRAGAELAGSSCSFPSLPAGHGTVLWP